MINSPFLETFSIMTIAIVIISFNYIFNLEEITYA
jgi:hypothetical protein